MSILRVLLREIQHRKLNFLSAMVAVMVAVALFVGVMTVRTLRGVRPNA